MVRLTCLLLAMLVVSGCGQKGPLYRPGSETPTEDALALTWRSLPGQSHAAQGMEKNVQGQAAAADANA